MIFVFKKNAFEDNNVQLVKTISGFHYLLRTSFLQRNKFKSKKYFAVIKKKHTFVKFDFLNCCDITWTKLFYMTLDLFCTRKKIGARIKKMSAKGKEIEN